jgi:hypothetical protein
MQLGFIDYDRTGDIEGRSALLNVVLRDQSHIKS